MRKIMSIAIWFLLSTSLVCSSNSELNRAVKESEKFSTANTAAALSVEERAILDCTNKERRKLGLTPFAPSSALVWMARKHSQNMCDAGTLKHESDDFPKGWQKFEERLKSVRVLSGGENVAYHSKLKDAEKWASLVVQGWMKSQEHKKNIVNTDYRFMGVGVSQCRGPISFATQVFSAEYGVVPSRNKQVNRLPAR